MICIEVRYTIEATDDHFIGACRPSLNKDNPDPSTWSVVWVKAKDILPGDHLVFHGIPAYQRVQTVTPTP